MSKINEIYEEADKTEKKFDFKAERIIDINNLHTEEQMNGELCFQYKKKRAKLQHIVERLEELKKITRSKLMKECAIDPHLCDPKDGKYTDKKAEAYYRTHNEYQEVIQALNEAKYELDCMLAMQQTFEDRKWALKDLTQLALSDYFESKETKETRLVHSVEEAHDQMMGSIKLNNKEENKDKKEELKKEAIEKTDEAEEKTTRRRSSRRRK